MSENPPAGDLVALVHDLVFCLEGEALPRFRNAWPQIGVGASPPEPEVSHLPGMSHPPRSSQLYVLRWLGQIGNDADSGGPMASLVASLRHGGSALAWRQTYTSTEVGEEFLSNYGYVEIVGPTAAVHSGELAAGFLMLGPHTTYPKHRHEAEEIYVPLSGTADWLQGDGLWRRRRPGTIIHHAAHEPHAMRTGVEPLLALYLWLSDDLKQKAYLE